MFRSLLPLLQLNDKKGTDQQKVFHRAKIECLSTLNTATNEKVTPLLIFFQKFHIKTVTFQNLPCFKPGRIVPVLLVKGVWEQNISSYHSPNTYQYQIPVQKSRCYEKKLPLAPPT